MALYGRRWSRGGWFAELSVPVWWWPRRSVVLRIDRTVDYISGRGVTLTLYWWPIVYVSLSTFAPRIRRGSLRPSRRAVGSR